METNKCQAMLSPNKLNGLYCFKPAKELNIDFQQIFRDEARIDLERAGKFWQDLRSTILALLDGSKDVCYSESMYELIKILRCSCSHNASKDSLSQHFLRMFHDEDYRFLHSLLDCFWIAYEKLKSQAENATMDADLANHIYRLLQCFCNLLTTVNMAGDKSHMEPMKKIIFDTRLYTIMLDLPKREMDNADSMMNKLSNVTNALLYLCLLNSSGLQDIFFSKSFLEENAPLWKMLMDDIEMEKSEYALYLCYLGLRCVGFFEHLTPVLSYKHNLMMYDIMQCYMDSKNKIDIEDTEPVDVNVSHNTIELPMETVSFIVPRFYRRIQTLLTANFEIIGNAQLEEIALVHKISSFLLKLSSFEEYLSGLQTYSELLPMLIILLEQIQKLAKDETNPYFRVQGRLADMSSEDVSLNPFFGFKRNIVGLIGNLVYANAGNQRYLRESDGLALLLDCTRIDANNPFIMQQAIFAIRNALKNNLENQAFVQEIRQQGEVAINNETLQKVLDETRQP